MGAACGGQGRRVTGRRRRRWMATDGDGGKDGEGERKERIGREQWRGRRTAHEREHRLFRLLGLGSGARAHAAREGGLGLGEGTIGVVLLAVLPIGHELAVVGSRSNGGAAWETHSSLAVSWVDAATAAAAAAAVVGLEQVVV